MKIYNTNTNFTGNNILITRKNNLHKPFLYNDVSKIISENHTPYTVFNDKIEIYAPSNSKNIKTILANLAKECINFEKIK